MKTLEEVKEHFKDAKEVRCLFDNEFYYVNKKQRGVYSIQYSCWITNSDSDEIKVYNCDDDKLAEIISYKSTKEKTPKKELKALLNLAKECLEQPDSIVCK